MDLQYILSQLHQERKRVNEVITILERLADGIVRRNLAASVGLQTLEGGRPKRTVSPETRAKLARAQRKRWAAAKKAANGG